MTALPFNIAGLDALDVRACLHAHDAITLTLRVRARMRMSDRALSVPDPTH